MDSSELRSIVNQCGFKDLTEITNSASKKRKLSICFSFRDKFEEHETEMMLGFNDDFPLSLPQYFIQSPDEFTQIPHIERDGKICYVHDDYVSLDYKNALGIVKQTYELAKRTIEKGVKKENQDDFSNEFEAYWGRIDGCELIMGCTEFLNEPELIKVAVHEKTKFVLTENIDIGRFIKLNEKKASQINAIFIPLPLKRIIPPRFHEKLKIDYFRELLQSLDSRALETLKKIINKKGDATYAFFSFTQPNENKGLFGIRFKGNGSIKSLLESTPVNDSIVAVSISRHDKEYMFKRGSNGCDPAQKKGLLIGAGSIGGFIAEELVRSGFFDITIIDEGTLSVENCYRHVTGYAYRQEKKATALKKKIELYYPHSTITAIDGRFEDLMKKNKIQLADYDFIIHATGNVTINLFYTKTHKEVGVPTFYSWNDPYGIGGHCLATNIGMKGCYECLYCGEVFCNLASFAAVEQSKPFLKSISGCGSFYTPYGSGDSIRTALLTIKAIQSAMSGGETQNSIYSWKGSSETFLKEGYVLSDRYSFTDDELIKNRHALYQSTCKTCSGK